jgi:hypothetical protein
LCRQVYVRQDAAVVSRWWWWWLQKIYIIRFITYYNNKEHLSRQWSSDAHSLQSGVIPADRIREDRLELELIDDDEFLLRSSSFPDL